MKRRKLTLEELQVQSFVTKLDSQLAHTAKGGDDDGTSANPCAGVTITLGGTKPSSGTGTVKNNTNSCIPPKNTIRVG